MCDAAGTTLLHVAADAGLAALARRLLLMLGGAEPSVRSTGGEGGSTGSGEGQTQSESRSRAVYCDVMNIGDRGGQTPLHCAVYAEEEEIARDLVACGASWDVPDEDGVTPRMEAPMKWREWM